MEILVQIVVTNHMPRAGLRKTRENAYKARENLEMHTRPRKSMESKDIKGNHWNVRGSGAMSFLFDF